MKRFHVHVSVDNIEQSVAFYSKLFGAASVKLEADYAKWMLEDPRVNSSRGPSPGIDHVGLQGDSPQELIALKSQFAGCRCGASGRAQAAAQRRAHGTCRLLRPRSSRLMLPAGVRAWHGTSDTAPALCC